MTPKKIKDLFFSFFQKQGHVFAPPSSVIPRQDASLLFTSAGMTQFKPLFCQEKPPSPDLLMNVQKCIRLTDLEEVGRTNRHLTSFEMLGSWSFGAYWKEEIIALAWEFTKKELQFFQDKIVITVHESDQETAEIWKKVGVSQSRIHFLGDEDNFWSLGKTGPCGPCTELHYVPFEGAPPDQWLEFWNLVFMQFERLKSGETRDLPFFSVDTGAGLERLCLILDQVSSVFETKSFLRLKKTLPQHWSDFLKDVLVDHSRTLALAFSEGGRFSNEGRGYALRKLARHALTQVLLEEKEECFWNQVGSYLIRPLDVLFEKDFFFDDIPDRIQIKNLIVEEEKTFAQTLEKGFGLFAKALEKGKKNQKLDPKKLFQLFDSHGFPFDVMKWFAEKEGLLFPQREVDLFMEEQREQSRRFSKFSDNQSHKQNWDWQNVNPLQEIPFPHREGFYGDLVHPVEVKKAEGEPFLRFDFPGWALKGLRFDKDKKELILFSSLSPFYPTSGGQVCDQGVLRSQRNPEKLSIPIYSVERWEDGFLLKGSFSQSSWDEVIQESSWFADIQAHLRKQNTIHHSAAHALVVALERVLQCPIEQAGSFVGPDYFRFDFRYSKPPTFPQLRKIEAYVNQLIQDDESVEKREGVSFQEAKAQGAQSFEEETYGDQVRTVRMGSSYELCGGTHVNRTSDMGVFLLLESSNVAKGVRRLVGQAGPAALCTLLSQQNLVKELESFYKTPQKDLMKRIQQERAHLESQTEAVKERDLAYLRLMVAKDQRLFSKGCAYVLLPDFLQKSLKLALEMLWDSGSFQVVWAICEKEEETFYAFKVGKDSLFPSAKDFVLKVNEKFQGKGGGQATFAQGRAPHIPLSVFLEFLKPFLLSFLSSKEVQS